jgi:hypothetical protein
MKSKDFKVRKPRRSKHVLGLHLPPDLELNLIAYCEAMDDAPKATVLRKALDCYIQSQLATNEGIRSNYETIRAALRDKESKLVPLHPVDIVKKQENSA